MTTFQGFTGDKSSSRVLRPPGGGDSNIFGSDEPPVHTQKRMAPQPPSNNIFGPPTPQNIPVKKREDTGSNIFGNPTSGQQPTVQSAEENNQDKEKDEEKEDEATQNNNDVPSLAQSANTRAKPMQQASYNPITGQGGEDPASTRNSSRVRQPPGGFSTKLW